MTEWAHSLNSGSGIWWVLSGTQSAADEDD